MMQGWIVSTIIHGVHDGETDPTHIMFSVEAWFYLGGYMESQMGPFFSKTINSHLYVIQILDITFLTPALFKRLYAFFSQTLWQLTMQRIKFLSDVWCTSICTNISNKMQLYYLGFYFKNSTCFRHSPCPSSGVHYCIGSRCNMWALDHELQCPVRLCRMVGGHITVVRVQPKHCDV
jgi:hypothetical protein